MRVRYGEMSVVITESGVCMSMDQYGVVPVIFHSSDGGRAALSPIADKLDSQQRGVIADKARHDRPLWRLYYAFDTQTVGRLGRLSVTYSGSCQLFLGVMDLYTSLAIK